MADIKNFSLAGVGSSVQFGKRGAQLKQAAGAFSFKNAADSAFANVSVAEPTVDDHAATKHYVDQKVGTEIGAINTARIQDDKTTPTAFVGTAESGDSGKVVVAASDGSAAKTVAVFQSGSTQNSQIVFDNATADKIIFEATGSSNDVNVAIVPKGEGVVEIGAPGSAAKVQSEDGQNLALAAGDNASGVGADLIIHGGHGSTGDGSVQITNGLEETIVKVAPTADATNHIELTNGTTTVEMSAVGTATDIDVKVTPKGTGVVDVGTHRISNVVDPTQDQDAATKAYVDSQVGAGSVANKIGSIQTRYFDVGNDNANIGDPVTGRIRRVMIHITQAYTAGTSINIGYAGTGNENALIDSAEIDETTVGTYELSSVDLTVTDTQLMAFVSGPFGLTGASTVVVEFIQG